MRTASSPRSFKKNIWKLNRDLKFKISNLLVIICILVLGSWLFSCASVGQKPTGKHFQKKVKIEHKRVPDTGASKEVIRNEPAPIASGATPKSRASLKMIENGRRALADGDFEKADREFQNAINIDPSNGIAYYYLARAKYELEQYQQAEGVLDKAEALLSGSSEWVETIDALRKLIKEKI